MANANRIIAFVIFLIILCAILAVCFLYKSNVDMVKVSRHYPNKTLIYDDYSFQDDRFVYLVCNKDNFNKCKIVQEKYPYRAIFKSCDVSFGTEKLNRTNESFIFVVAFGEDKAILMWDDAEHLHDQPYVNINIVHFNECRQIVSGPRSYFATKQLNNVKKIITYGDTFDVFYKNNKSCGNKECRLRFNNNGKSDNLDYLIVNLDFDVSNIYPVSHNSSDKRYVHVKSGNGLPGFFLTRSDETDVSLMPFRGDFKISVVNETIGLCTKVNRNTTCYQYDSEGKLKLNISLVDVHNNTDLKSIYTLPDKGFLFSFAEFGRCEEDVCDPEILTTYFIEKVNDTGKSLGKLRFQGLEKDYKIIRNSYIYKHLKKDDKFCAFIEPFRQFDRIEIFVNCFPMSNFHQ